ncbi:D-2-hydroxyacid dehydrogenase [Aestuariibacter salexigens]|uniref:D-2-hydroxyacid dehydrogenase n=1 Tax=Aestuariibacter salexigens TaxID=226010 RepID=UPI0003FBF1B6|nr:D-2-hydroxyacid dehydrogenase [Aestuariibacter salexigens]
MNKLSILSKDAQHYATLFKTAKFADLEINAYQTLPEHQSVADTQIFFGNPQLIARAIDEGARPRWVQSSWAGNTPLLNSSWQGFTLTGVKGVFGSAMCEYVFTYLLYFSRNVEGFRQAQQQRDWCKPSYSALNGKTLGIMGVGDIGSAVASMALQWGMQVIGLSRSGRPHSAVSTMYASTDKLAFAAELDFVVCLLPDTPDTEHLIDDKFLRTLPSHCVLINAGRGSVIDDAALVGCLQARKIKAAVLDVFQHEPLPASHPYWLLDNVYITQHTAAESTPEMIAPIFIDNYSRYIQGKPLQYVIDFAKGY